MCLEVVEAMEMLLLKIETSSGWYYSSNKDTYIYIYIVNEKKGNRGARLLLVMS